MNKFFIALALALATGICATAQTNEIVDDEKEGVQLQMLTPAVPVTETKEEIKEREKNLRMLNDDIAYAKACNSLKRGYFVLVAENIQLGNTGYRRYDINSNSNFVLVQDNDGIVQVALNNGKFGSNGIGGWTGKGQVKDKRIKCDDNGDIHLDYNLISSKVNAHVSITLFHNGKHAVARITGGIPITIYGDILPYRDKEHR